MINLNWTMVMQIINFLVLMIVLNKLLFQPILNIIDERKAATEGKEADAKNMEQESESIVNKYNEKIKQAKIDATSKKQEIKGLGSKEEEKIISAARQEGEEVVNKIKDEIAKEVESARQNLTEQAKQMSEMIFTKLLGRNPA